MNTKEPSTNPHTRGQLAFIDLRRKIGASEDATSLALNYRKQSPGYIQIIGGLPHCAEIAPRSESARLALIAWLESDECKAAASKPFPA